MYIVRPSPLFFIVSAPGNLFAAFLLWSPARRKCLPPPAQLPKLLLNDLPNVSSVLYLCRIPAQDLVVSECEAYFRCVFTVEIVFCAIPISTSNNTAMQKSDDSDVEFDSASEDDEEEFESSGSGSSDFEDDVVVKKKPAPKKAAAPKGKAASAKKGKENKETNSKRGRSAKAEPAAVAPTKKAKAANDKPAKPAVVSDAKAVAIIKEYMLKANRPYSHLNVYDNLHGVVKKPSVPKILNQLSDEGILQQKDFGKVGFFCSF